MKAWRKQPCPRGENGRKRKGANRRAKDAGGAQPSLLGLVAGEGLGFVSPVLQRMFSLGEIPRIAQARLDALAAERKAKRRSA